MGSTARQNDFDHGALFCLRKNNAINVCRTVAFIHTRSFFSKQAGALCTRAYIRCIIGLLLLQAGNKYVQDLNVPDTESFCVWVIRYDCQDLRVRIANMLLEVNPMCVSCKSNSRQVR